MSTTQSHRAPIYYVDLTIREGRSLEEAITEAREVDAQRKASGFDQAALDAIARAGFGNGVFEDSDEEIPAVIDEFYAEGEPNSQATSSPATMLKDKLDRKAATQNGGPA